MTKEDMEKLLKAREKRIEKEKQKEKQNMKLQVERLLVLIENMKEDLEIKKLISDAKLSKHIKSFYCYERENKMGFHERRNDVFLQDLFILNKWREQRFLAFDPYDLDEKNIRSNFYVEDYRGGLTSLEHSSNCSFRLSSDLLKSFCNNYEKFHKEFHQKLDSVNWDVLDA